MVRMILCNSLCACNIIVISLALEIAQRKYFSDLNCKEDFTIKENVLRIVCNKQIMRLLRSNFKCFHTSIKIILTAQKSFMGFDNSCEEKRKQNMFFSFLHTIVSNIFGDQKIG